MINNVLKISEQLLFLKRIFIGHAFVSVVENVILSLCHSPK